MAGLKLRAASRALWQLRRGARILARQAGWPGLAAIALVALALTGATLSTRLGARAADLSNRLSLTAKDVDERAAPASAASGIESFRAFLPLHDDIPDTVKRLLLLAEDHGLTFESGEYKAEAEEGFISYRMVLPVKGDAAAIQSFLLDALKRHPTLALESMAFHRARIESREVEARLHFSLLTRLPEPGGKRSAQ